MVLLSPCLASTAEDLDEIGFPEPNPEAFPIRESEGSDLGLIPPTRQANTQFYETGEITPDEQQYIEYINRARKDPNAEGKRLQLVADPEVLSALNFFNTDLNELFSDEINGFQTFEPAPPLAPNPKIRAGAEIHTMDMFENTYQGHVNANGENAGDRITAAGYTWQTFGENVFSTSKSNFYGHAGFQIDWGEGGIQNPPGHRLTIHSGNFNEIGVSVINGSKDKLNDGDPIRRDVGPQLVTQVFAKDFNETSFITGVAYYDLNENSFYDKGEEIPGLRVATAQGTFFTQAAQSGGYAIPSEDASQYTVIFTDDYQTLEIPSGPVVTGVNKKVDLILPYSGTEIRGPENLSTLHDVTLFSSQVFGINGYDWELSKVVTGLFQEGAESGVVPFEQDTSDGFNIITSKAASEGAKSFHLFHNTNPPIHQKLIWEDVFFLSESSSLSFKSKHAFANTTQIASVDIRELGSRVWQSIWVDAGDGGAGDSSFTLVNLPLSEYAGKAVNLRFSYDFQGGSFFHGIGNPDPNGLGWYIDEIQLAGSEKYILEASGSSADPTASFSVRPQSVGSYAVISRPILGDNKLPWGQEWRVQAIAESVDQSDGGKIAFEYLGVEVINPQTLQIRIRIEEGVTGELDLRVSSSKDVAGSFTTLVNGATITNINEENYAVNIPMENNERANFFIISLE